MLILYGLTMFEIALTFYWLSNVMNLMIMIKTSEWNNGIWNYKMNAEIDCNSTSEITNV